MAPLNIMWRHCNSQRSFEHYKATIGHLATVKSTAYTNQKVCSSWSCCCHCYCCCCFCDCRMLPKWWMSLCLQRQTFRHLKRRHLKWCVTPSLSSELEEWLATLVYSSSADENWNVKLSISGTDLLAAVTVRAHPAKIAQYGAYMPSVCFCI